MAGNAGGILKGGGGKSSGEPDTDEIVTRSPLSMVRIGTSLASKKPQWTVSGPASMCGISCDLCNEYLQSKFGKDRGARLSKFHEDARTNHKGTSNNCRSSQLRTSLGSTAQNRNENKAESLAGKFGAPDDQW